MFTTHTDMRFHHRESDHRLEISTDKRTRWIRLRDRRNTSHSHIRRLCVEGTSCLSRTGCLDETIIMNYEKGAASDYFVTTIPTLPFRRSIWLSRLRFLRRRLGEKQFFLWLGRKLGIRHLALIGGRLSRCGRMLITLSEHRIRELTREQGTHAECDEGRALSTPASPGLGPFHISHLHLHRDQPRR